MAAAASSLPASELAGLVRALANSGCDDPLAWWQVIGAAKQQVGCFAARGAAVPAALTVLVPLLASAFRAAPSAMPTSVRAANTGAPASQPPPP
jgi:hypothetical protein